MNINALKNLPGEVGRIRYVASHAAGMHSDNIRRHLDDIADALEPMIFTGHDQERLVKFHDVLFSVMAAVQDCNKNYRGRPTDVKRTYLENHYSVEIADLAMILIGQDIGQFYQKAWESTDKPKRIAIVDFGPTVLRGPVTAVPDCSAYNGVFLEPPAELEKRT